MAVLIAGAVAVSGSAIFVRESEVGPIATGVYRMALGLPLLVLWRAWEVRRNPAAARPPARPREWLVLVLCGALFAGDLAMWHLALGHTRIANAAFLVNMAPAFAAVGAYFVLQQPIGWRFLTGLAVAMAGAALLAGPSLGQGQMAGDLMALGGAGFWGAYVVAVAAVRRRFTTSQVMLWTAVFGSATLVPIALAAGEVLVPATLHGWIILLGLALIAHAGGQSCIAFALSRVPAAPASLILLGVPIPTVLMAWAILGEQPSWHQAVGGAIVLAGIGVAQRSRAGS